MSAIPLHACATPQATKRYAERFQLPAAKGHFRQQQDLWLASIGIGTYLGDADEATDTKYTDAVIRAVQLGANVIDTAANYRFQRSERCIGKALADLIQQDRLSREEIVICTKGGYLPFDGAPPRDVRSYIEATFVRPGIAKLHDFAGGSHCMTPSFLESQLEQSRKNLGVDCIDVYYVHNPESQLAAIPAEEFYSRLRDAFGFLEKSRAEGKIRMYGVATWNGFRSPAQSPEYHSVERMTSIANEVAGTAHGFRFIQLPFNLAMTEALTLRNQAVDGQQLSTLEAASALGITVVSSASILQGRVAANLPPSLRKRLGSLATDAQTAIQFVRSTPGITTALVGMSNRVHVEENLWLAEIAPISSEDFVQLFSHE